MAVTIVIKVGLLEVSYYMQKTTNTRFYRKQLYIKLLPISCVL